MLTVRKFRKLLLTRLEFFVILAKLSARQERKILMSEQRANLENDTEETRTDRGIAKMARRPERGSETEEQSEFYE